MHITIFGSGYVGLVTGCCFAEMGNMVTVVDIDQQRVERLKAGEPIIYEPGLAGLQMENIRTKRLTFTIDAAAAIRSADALLYLCWHANERHR